MFAVYHHTAGACSGDLNGLVPSLPHMRTYKRVWCEKAQSWYCGFCLTLTLLYMFGACVSVKCGGGCGGTLLGCRSTSPTPCGCWLLVSSWNTTEAFGWGGVGGLLFVNYIVDASIFERRALMIGAHPLGWVLVVGVWCVFLMIICVVWRISCYGHTVDALASGADEGRGNLR